MGGHSLLIAAGKRRLPIGLRSGGVVGIRKHTANFFASRVTHSFQIPGDLAVAAGAKLERLRGQPDNVERLPIFIINAVPDIPPVSRVTGQHELYAVRFHQVNVPAAAPVPHNLLLYDRVGFCARTGDGR